MSSLMNSAMTEKSILLSLRVQKAGYLSVLQSTCIKSMKLAKKSKVILMVMSLFILKTVKRSKQNDGYEERSQFLRSQLGVSSSGHEEFNTSWCKRPDLATIPVQ